jgi:hypothetical protein
MRKAPGNPDAVRHRDFTTKPQVRVKTPEGPGPAFTKMNMKGAALAVKGNTPYNLVERINVKRKTACFVF